MPPAFANTKQAAAFALLLLFLLAAPWLAGKTFLPQRSQTYSSQSIRWEKFPWMQKFIFEETNDIDIAFVGSSHMGTAMDTRYVQQKLSEKLGREAVVRSIYYASPGFDALYYFSVDLLAHRRVNTLVFDDECSVRIPYEVHASAPHWFRYGGEGGALSGLPVRYQAIYYYAAMIGMPRNLLELLVPNLPTDPSDQLVGVFAYAHAANPEVTLGALCVRLNFDTNFPNRNMNFAPYTPQNKVAPADVSLFDPATATNFVFSNKAISAAQSYFAKKFGLLAKAHGCNLVAINIPTWEERTSPVITESRDWRSLMEGDVCLLGIPAARLFAGLSDSDLKKICLDMGHFNVNGQKFFTTVVTPALIECYASQPHQLMRKP